MDCRFHLSVHLQNQSHLGGNPSLARQDCLPTVPESWARQLAQSPPPGRTEPIKPQTFNQVLKSRGKEQEKQATAIEKAREKEIKKRLKACRKAQADMARKCGDMVGPQNG